MSLGESVFVEVDSKVKLEATVSYSDNETGDISFIITHPHPKFGGNMENNVVNAVFSALKTHPLCHSVIKFNFRGVRKSTGSSSWRGWSERSDVEAIANYMQNILPELKNISQPKNIIIIGYSFGSVVGCGISSVIPSCIGTVAISYPVGWSSWVLFSNHYPYFRDNELQKLLIIGTNDNFTSKNTFENYFNSMKGPKESVIVPGKDHFWFGSESIVVSSILDWLSKHFMDKN